MNKKVLDTIKIPIGESDIEMFKDLVYQGMDFSWEFHTEDNNDLIKVMFIPEHEGLDMETPEEANEWLRRGGW